MTRELKKRLMVRGVFVAVGMGVPALLLGHGERAVWYSVAIFTLVFSIVVWPGGFDDYR